MARGCALIDSRLDTAKICSDKRVHVDHAQLPAVFGGEKTFSHGLGPKRKYSPRADNFRGRDASYLAPPAQIRTSPIRAYGSHLGGVTARRDIVTKYRLRFRVCYTVTR